MQQKLKSVFRRSSKSRSSSGQHEQVESSSQRAEAHSDRHRASSDRHGRASVESSVTGSVYTGRSRPVSAVHDERQDKPPAKHTAATDPPSTSTSNGGAIANDYKAYLPALSPVNDEHGDGYMNVGGHGLHSTAGNQTHHEEDVADGNTARHRMSNEGGHRDAPSISNSGLTGNASDSHTSKSTPGQQYRGRPSAGTNTADIVRSLAQAADHSGEHIHGQTSNGNGNIINGNKLHAGKGTLPVAKDNGSAYDVRGLQYATINGTAHGDETALAKKLRKEGIVDLRNTVDTDGEINWAPAVTHEVIKPHQHEIIQHKIYREIHNYEHFHRIQPVMMTEVLPPRHWIPNPDGPGLIEISADELPARTGENRWWSICQHSSPYSMLKTTQKYRTEPEIIEAGTFITKEGFERKETIIIHPPTLADLTGYGGPVQAMHFDHKSGKSWMGELTTMDKLNDLQQQLDRAPDMHTFHMNGLAESLPKTSSGSARRSSTSMPHRKPVSVKSPVVHGSNVGRGTIAA